MRASLESMRRGEREQGGDSLFKDRVAENIPNLRRDRTPKPLKLAGRFKISVQNSFFFPPRYQDKEFLKEQEKRCLSYKGIP